MATVDIDLVGGNLGVSGHFTLTQIIPGSEYPAEHFWSSEILHSRNSEVHKGILQISADRVVEAVCKITLGDLSRLKQEAKCYADPNHLLPLQGYCVPRFLGYYTCEFEFEERDMLLGCMILEYCGEPVPTKLLYDKMTKVRIMDAMGLIHSRAHLEHGDFGYGNRHAVMRGSEETGDVDIRIVDFSEASKHTCERKMQVKYQDWEPNVADFGCNELYDIAWSLGAWTPSLVCLFGDYYSIFRVPTVERLVEWAMHRNKMMKREYVEPRAKAALADYYRQYSKRFKRIGDPRDPSKLLPLLIPERIAQANTTSSAPTPPPDSDSD